MDQLSKRGLGGPMGTLFYLEHYDGEVNMKEASNFFDCVEDR